MVRIRRLKRAHFILYVQDQESSTRFYSSVLGSRPVLHVPNMTEFALPGDAVLGLMPESAIRNLLGPALSDPAAHRPPRAEVYLVVSDASQYHARSLAAGGRELSPLLKRNWGHWAAYSLDLDGHVLAFAQLAEPE